MRQWLDRYYGSLRKVKLNYVLLNLANARRLRHTQAMLRRHGSSVRRCFPGQRADAQGARRHPWLHRPGAIEALAADPRVQALPPAFARGGDGLAGKGLPDTARLFRRSEVAAINAEVTDRSIGRRSTSTSPDAKIMFAFRHSDLLRNVVPTVASWTSWTVAGRRRMRPFQSINFLTGSEQAAHSDSIHYDHPPARLPDRRLAARSRCHRTTARWFTTLAVTKLPHAYDRYDHGGTWIHHRQ